jgi:hypothetical protein
MPEGIVIFDKEGVDVPVKRSNLKGPYALILDYV